MVGSVFWFEFLLNKDLLANHLRQQSAEPSATTLLTQFIQNSEKWKDTLDEEDSLEKISRAKKSRVLRKLALRTAAFLSWDLDKLASLPMPAQFSLMNYATEFGGDSLFLKSLYHRWILRSSQIVLKRTNLQEDPAAETILRSLSPENSLLQLSTLLATENQPIPVPTLSSFVKDNIDSALCDKISVDVYNSIIHFDIGLYHFYKGQIQNAIEHFQQHQYHAELSPYLTVTREKLNGYLRGLGLLPSEKKPDEMEPFERRTVTIAKIMRSGNSEKMKGFINLDFVLDDSCPPLKAISMDEFESDNFDMQKQLLEATDMNQIKEILIKLHAASGGSRAFAKLFSKWEIPIPLHNGISNILPGAFQDYVHILVCKSQQLLDIKHFLEARTCLQVAQSELSLHLQSIAPALAPYIFSITKLGKILEWEVLLVDLCQMFEDFPKQNKHLLSRCTECLMCFKHQSPDVSPRSEIIENILMALLNVGEFEQVASFEQFPQKWPFLEFLTLVAKACTDLVELKDSAASYRELWHVVLPHFSISNSVRRQPLKTGSLSSRSMLFWVLERARSHCLLQLFISLFARLHNHYTDDMGLQIATECLHIWPNVLDDITTSADAKLRVSGASKLNAKQIRDVLNSLLRKSAATEVSWLKCMGDVQLASGNPALAMKCYLEYLAVSTDSFEKHSVSHWADNNLFRRMIKCSEILQAYTQALVLCQFLTDVDYSTAFGMAQEKVTTDAGDSLYGFIWDLTILEFLINLHTKRSEFNKRQHAMKIMGLMELNSSNNEEIQREAMHLRKSQFMRTLAKIYIFS